MIRWRYCLHLDSRPLLTPLDMGISLKPSNCIITAPSPKKQSEAVSLGPVRLARKPSPHLPGKVDVVLRNTSLDRDQSPRAACSLSLQSKFSPMAAITGSISLPS